LQIGQARVQLGGDPRQGNRDDGDVQLPHEERQARGPDHERE